MTNIAVETVLQCGPSYRGIAKYWLLHNRDKFLWFNLSNEWRHKIKNKWVKCTEDDVISSIFEYLQRWRSIIETYIGGIPELRLYTSTLESDGRSTQNILMAIHALWSQRFSL